MCLITCKKAEDEWQPFVAKKDIVVWKIGRRIQIGDILVFFSFFQGYEYSPNELNPPINLEVIPTEEDSDLGAVYKGYHAYLASHKTSHPSMKYERFIIPKGSQYYLGDDTDIVSSQIIWHPRKSIKDFFENLVNRVLKRRYNIL